MNLALHHSPGYSIIDSFNFTKTTNSTPHIPILPTTTTTTMHSSQVFLTGMLAAFAHGSLVEKPFGTPTTTSTTIGPRQLVVPSINSTLGNAPYIDTGVGPVSVTDMPPTATTTLNRRQLVTPSSGALWGNLSNIVAQHVSVSNSTLPTIVADAGMMTLAAVNSPWKTNFRHDRTTIYATTTVQGVVAQPTREIIPSCYDMDAHGGYKGYYFRLRHFATKDEAIRMKEAALSFWLDRSYTGQFRPERKRIVLFEKVMLEDDGTWVFEVTLAQRYLVELFERRQWQSGWLSKIIQREMGVSPYIMPGQIFNRNGCWDPDRCEADGGVWAERIQEDGDLMCMRPCRENEKKGKWDLLKDGKRYCNTAVSVPR